MSQREQDDLARTILEKRFVTAEELVATRPLSAAAPPPAGGKPFGKYLLLRQVGEGGFGRVFLAVDPLLQRRVALKLLKGGAPDDIARFGREARMAAELRHPNIVPVHDVGQVGRDCYIAFEFIEGAPLMPSALERDLVIGLKIARALGAAHARGMIHRDVKPQNILVDAEGEPFLTDFGLARHVGGGSLTRSGSLVGTPGFMSPEQARGELRLLGPESDVFSLGATLYYLFTRRAAFEGETELEVIRKVIETQPRPPRAVDPRIPAEVEAILAKAMAKDPRRRYATADAFADDLQRFLERRPVLAARRRLLLPAAASAVLGALAVTALLWPRPGPPPIIVAAPPPVPKAAPPRPPDPPPPVAVEAPKPAPVREPERPAPKAPVRNPEPAPELPDPQKAFLAAAVAAREPDPRRAEYPDEIRIQGRTLEVKILEEAEGRIVYRYKGQTVAQPAAAVESVSRNAAPVIQFHARLQAATTRDLPALADWCRERRLEAHREYVLYRLLAADPSHAAARSALGFSPEGPITAPPADAIAYEGRTYTAAELRQALLDRGFRVVDGRWCSVKDWRWAPREPWASARGSDVAVRSHDEVRVESRYDLDQRKIVQVERRIAGFRFVGPAPGRTRGTAILEIEPPAPIVECRILAAASIPGKGGSIAARVEAPGRPALPLFSIAAGRHRKPIDLGEALLGERRFSIVAEIESDAAFLPGDAPEPLVVEGRIAEPRPDLDALLPPK